VPQRNLPHRYMPLWIVYALLLVMPLLFSSNIIIGRAAMAYTPPVTMAFCRWVLALMILLPFCAADIRAHWPRIRANLPLLLLMGALAMGICGAVVYIGLGRTEATNAALIYATSPIFILIIDALFYGAALRARQILGIALAFAGVALIVLRGEPQHILQLRLNDGDLLIGLASISWALYSILLKRKSLAGIPTLAVFASVMAGGIVVLAPFFIFELMITGGLPAEPRAWASIFGVALFPSVLAFSIYKFAIKQVGAPQTSMFLYLMPVYAAGLAVLFLGEVLHLYHIFGLLLVLPGIVIATTGKVRA